MALTFYSTGQCLLNLNQSATSLYYFQKTLQIDERVTSNSEIDEILSLTLENVGRCLLKLGHDVEGKAYLEKSRLIRDRVAATNN